MAPTPPASNAIALSDSQLKSHLASYYASLESRIGYRLLLGGTRHFGYYNGPRAPPLPLTPALRQMEHKLAAALSLQRGARVLDCGCGVGHVALAVAQVLGVQVQGIDFMERHVAHANRNAVATGLASRVSALRLDYHDAATHFAPVSFDGAYTMETLVHARDAAQVLAGLATVIKPRGVLVLHEYENYMDPSAPAWLQEAFESVCKQSSMPSWPRFTPGVLERLVNDAGFDVEHVADFTAHVKPMVWLFWALAVLPYYLLWLLAAATGVDVLAHFPNTLAGYCGWRAWGSWRYVQVKARRRET